ncbi:hypothetical protein EV698_0997 [Spiribacter vilamensis]|uniref:Uncharacterized protein n=3 Tax=Spiribacter vilamensis TaxID=531306 RepID=A0A4Q8D099_9GAMM|nr:hypothetical protein EV698_0997 [Spiribacter vilamensis]
MDLATDTTLSYVPIRLQSHALAHLGKAPMPVDKIGRNDPCSCGERNRRPVDDFRGLSPDQMYRLLHFPLDSPDVLQVSTVLESEPDTPLAHLFGLLAEAIGDKGLKPTAKGNFPRNACREIMQSFLGESGYADYTRIGGINGEHDAPELHATRVVAELAGFVRKYRGRFILSRPARAMLASTGQRELYSRLFRTYATEFNWAYQDGFAEMPFIQQGWGFTAYLLHLDGHRQQPATLYADAFRQAFPAVDIELEGESLYRSLEETWRLLYTVRCLERFADFTGIAMVRREGGGFLTDPQAINVQATPLLSRLIDFRGEY